MIPQGTGIGVSTWPKSHGSIGWPRQDSPRAGSSTSCSDGSRFLGGGKPSGNATGSAGSQRAAKNLLDLDLGIVGLWLVALGFLVAAGLIVVGLFSLILARYRVVPAIDVADAAKGKASEAKAKVAAKL